MKHVKAPNKYSLAGKVSLFFCGSIEMGKAEPWNLKLSKALSEFDNLLILDPRREDWDSSWIQEKENPQFNEQVTWELQAQEDVDFIVVYFDPKTQSPITLLEVGAFKDKPMILLCPEGYFRKGNVDIFCERYGIQQASGWDDFVAQIKDTVEFFEKSKMEKAWEK